MLPNSGDNRLSALLINDSLRSGDARLSDRGRKGKVVTSNRPSENIHGPIDEPAVIIVLSIVHLRGRTFERLMNHIYRQVVDSAHGISGRNSESLRIMRMDQGTHVRMAWVARHVPIPW